MRSSQLRRAAIAFILCAVATSGYALSNLVNLSTRMRVENGDNVLIGGFIVTGSAPKNIILRAIGPSLPVTGALADPVLELHDASGAIVASNDDWRATQQDAIIATGLAPANDRDSALIAKVNSGNYTAAVRGANNGPGPTIPAP